MTIKEKEIEILRAALKVFSEKGFHDAKIVDIAKEAGIGKGTVYEYFNSKEQLFKEIIKYSVNKYSSGLVNIIDEKNTLENTLIKISEFHGQFIEKNKSMALAMMSNSINISTDMILWIASKRSELSNLIKELLCKGKNKELRNDFDDDAATLAFIGGINQYYVKKIYFENLSYKDIDPSPLLDIILNGLKNK